MAKFPEFKPSIREVHHIHKKDSPSGTAYTLLEELILHHPSYTNFELNGEAEHATPGFIPVEAIREGDVKGIHEVMWKSEKESISIRHDAHDRRIFAEGAVMAATWLLDKPAGEYTMKDIIRL